MQNNSILATGTIVGGAYRVLDFVGQGAMGYVYKVEQISLAKVLALKLLRTEDIALSDLKRFQLEAKAIARLKHPNVIQVYDMSQTEEGLAYYTMDFLSGLSLADYMDDYGPLDATAAIPIFVQICHGLAYAHEHGVIHRDIKPGNIMLEHSGDWSEDLAENLARCNAKIVDFGIAKVVDNGALTSQGLTRPGEVFGSPLYMSPEQSLGGKIDHRADIYSLGVTFFQALTGRPPILGRTPIETTILHQTEPPLKLNQAGADNDLSFSTELEAIIGLMLEKDPQDRYSSLEEVADDLLAATGSSKPGTASFLEQSTPSFGRTSAAGTFEASYAAPAAKSALIKVQTEKSFPVKVAMSAASAIILGAVVAGAMYMSRTKPAPVVNYNKAISNPLDKPLSEYFVDNFDKKVLKVHERKLLSRSLDDGLKKKVQKFLASSPEKFRVAKEANYSDFVFPEDFSLGKFVRLDISDQEGHEAQGKVRNYHYKNTQFLAGDVVAFYPELLDLFSADDIEMFKYNGGNNHFQGLTKALMRLNRIDTLDLPDCILDANDWQNIDTLPNLVALNIDDAKLDGNIVAKSKSLPRLYVLSAEGITHPSEVLRTLRRSARVKVLNLSHAPLTHDDFSTIAKIGTLNELLLNNTAINDAEMLKLTALPLSRLYLSDCANLTPACVKISEKFPHMQLQLPRKLEDWN